MTIQRAESSLPAENPELARTNQIKRWMTVGLGALWLLDGLLQLQPPMFTESLANLVGNAMMSLPAPLYFASLRALVQFVMPHIAFWNACFATLQLAIGISLLAGTAGIKKAALVSSVIWGLILWVFAEGMAGILAGTMSGGVFPGTPSIVSGFPGAALIYAVIALILLLPSRNWNLSSRYSVVRIAPALVFLVSAVMQAAPLMWTRYGQASIFAANLDNLPSQLVVTLQPVLNFTVTSPALSNALELGATITAAIVLFAMGFRPSIWGYVFALAWLGFIWWFGLGLGGTLTGAGTDPNTPPAIALLMVPAIAASRKSWGKREK